MWLKCVEMVCQQPAANNHALRFTFDNFVTYNFCSNFRSGMRLMLFNSGFKWASCTNLWCQLSNWQRKTKILWETWYSATLSSTDPKWTKMRLNLGLQRDKLMANCMTYGTTSIHFTPCNGVLEKLIIT
jgi:hypothetical protein